MAKKATKKIEGDVITITFTEGDPLIASLNDLSDEIVHRLAMHGLSQKLGDSYASGEVQEARERAVRVWEDLKSGNWTTRVAGGGTRTSLLIEALIRATGKSQEEVIARVEEMDDDEKKGLRKHPQVKKAMAEIKVERAAAEAAAAAKAAGEEMGPIAI